MASVNGHIPLNFDWAATHDYGGFGYRTTSSGLAMVDGARVHNVEDGWKPRESAASREVSATYPNVGTMSMRDVYMTGIRDDAIEDDEFMPGDIQDSLFDGVWCFLSEQNQTGGNPATIGSGEDRNIRITRDYVRLSVTNGGETGAGHWFKWQGRGSQNHTLVITDSVFAVDSRAAPGLEQPEHPGGHGLAGEQLHPLARRAGRVRRAEAGGRHLPRGSGGQGQVEPGAQRLAERPRLRASAGRTISIPWTIPSSRRGLGGLDGRSRRSSPLPRSSRWLSPRRPHGGIGDVRPGGPEHAIRLGRLRLRGHAREVEGAALVRERSSRVEVVRGRATADRAAGCTCRRAPRTCARA